MLNGSVTTTGAQTYNDAVLAGTISLTSTGGGNITAINGANDFTGTLTLKGGTVEIRDANGLAVVLGTGTTTLNAGDTLTLSGSAGSLDATSGGAVSQSGALTVTGTTDIDAGSSSVTLTDAGNDFGGQVTVAGGATQDNGRQRPRRQAR